MGWAAVAGGATVAGIGFTVALLVAALSFTGEQLQEATLGILSAAVVASAGTWVLSWVTGRLPARRRTRALLGTGETIVDLAAPVDPGSRPHPRPRERPGHRGRVRRLPVRLPRSRGTGDPGAARWPGDVRYVWRHLPLSDVHPYAQFAAEAAEAAARRDLATLSSAVDTAHKRAAAVGSQNAGS